MIVTPSFFGTHIQGEWINDAGDSSPHVTKFFGLHRFWDGRAVWWKMLGNPGYGPDSHALEANIRFAANMKAEPMFTFGEPPSSAIMSDYEKVPTMAAWESFVRHVVTVSAGRIRLYEGWNEPGLPQYWDGTPEELVTYERRRYQITKEMQPDSIIVSPSFTEPTLPRGRAFIERYLTAGGGDWCDEVAFHGYAEKPEHLIHYTEGMLYMMRKYGVNKRLRDTEYAIGDSLRREYMAQSFIIHAAFGIPWVWNSHVVNDYTDPTAREMADILIGGSVGPLKHDGGTWRAVLSKPGVADQEFVWTQQSYPVLGPVSKPGPNSPAEEENGGCLSKFLPFLR